MSESARLCTRCGSPDPCATLALELAGDRVEIRLCADCLDSFGRWIDQAEFPRRREPASP
jgi:hypothetical protein